MEQITREEMIELLAAAICPANCYNGAIVRDEQHGEIEQCRFCYERELAITALQAAEPEECKLQMNAYYYGFDATGVHVIDKILSAVAWAGRAFHNTEDWLEECGSYEDHTGDSPVEWIQNAADEAAAALALPCPPAQAQMPEGWEISAAEGGRIVIKNKGGGGVVVEDSDRTEAIAENILHRLASALLTASPAPVSQEAKDQVLEDWPALNAFIQDYLDGYELRGDGDYTPNDKEKFLIEDCVAGLIDELGIKPSMVKKLSASPAPEHSEDKLEMVEVPFRCLALGTRFYYKNDFTTEYVKIDHLTVAIWQDDMAITNTGWLGQGVYSFDDNNDTSIAVLVAAPAHPQQEEAER